MRLAVFAVSVLALAACQPAAKAPAAEATKDAPAAAAADVPTPVAVKPVSFDPLSKTAEAVTGAVSLTSTGEGSDGQPTMKLETSNGSVYKTSLRPAGAQEATAIDWSKIFNTKIDFDPQAPADIPSVDLHIVTGETISTSAPNGGFCGKDKTYAFAMAIPISTPTGVMMSIAAFKGDAWPPKDESALCGVYNYNAPH
ncbi:MAG: hypothetical protein GC155_02485 [Alphaproteobacteria bacterium]|nr:hypothetical protein [Alphaproteobacteria bacterium]